MKLPRAIQDMRTIKTLLTAAEAEAQRAGADPAGFRAAVDAAHRQALDGIGVQVPGGDEPLPEAAPPGGLYRLTAPGQEVFQSAVQLAKAGQRSPLQGAHVVAAVGEQERGTVARALKTLGVDRAALTTAAGEVLTKH